MEVDPSPAGRAGAGRREEDCGYGVFGSAYAFGVVLLEMLTGMPPFDPETREPLVDAVYVQMQHPKRHMRDLVDPRAGDWNAKAWRALSAVALRCSEAKVIHRCKVADVVDEIDALAGRGGSRRRGWLGSWF